jgi:hypothetical protein
LEDKISLKQAKKKNKEENTKQIEENKEWKK